MSTYNINEYMQNSDINSTIKPNPVTIWMNYLSKMKKIKPNPVTIWINYLYLQIICDYRHGFGGTQKGPKT